MIRRLNHAVLYVSDGERSVDFYTRELGFTVVERLPGAAFLRGADSDNHHDLGLFEVGAQARPGDLPGRRPVGLYHLAWEVGTLRTLLELRERGIDNRWITGESDHGSSKSIYGRDPDGIEFEVMWAVPSAHWPEGAGYTRRVDWTRELETWG